MNKFKKKTCSKMIAASIAILSSAAVVSTGFAAWVISGGDAQETTGTIKADTVSNSYHTIKLGEANKTEINFGAPAEDDTVTNPWLKNTSMGQEKLLAEFTFTVGNVKTGEDTPELFSSISLSAGADTTYSAASGEGLVSVLPTSWAKENFDTTPSYDSKTGKGSAAGIYLVKTSGKATDAGAELGFTLYIQFTWGEKFGGKNPFYFYNEDNKTASADGNSAKSNLDTVAAIKNVTFTLTIKAN